jgi:hypothetical protein
MDRVVYFLLLCYPNQDIGVKRYIHTELVGDYFPVPSGGGW